MNTPSKTGVATPNPRSKSASGGPSGATPTGSLLASSGVSRSPKSSLVAGAWQFPAGPDIAQNLAHLQEGIRQAACRNVRLLLTQECALTGYPPVETPSLAVIDRAAQAEAFAEICLLAKEHRMYIALGNISFGPEGTRNTLSLIGPDGTVQTDYHKRALWGWDTGNFVPGSGNGGIHLIDGFRVALRICFEVRFPEYFREALAQDADLVLVAFADNHQNENPGKLDIIRSHLVSRAAENGFWVLSANSTSLHQLAPTCLVDPDGQVLETAPHNRRCLLVRTIADPEPNFGRQGRITLSRQLMQTEAKLAYAPGPEGVST